VGGYHHHFKASDGIVGNFQALYMPYFWRRMRRRLAFQRRSRFCLVVIFADIVFLPGFKNVGGIPARLPMRRRICETVE